MAQRGNFAVAPKIACCAKASTFTAAQGEAPAVGNAERQRANRAQVLGDLLAALPVAAGRALNQLAIAIEHFDAAAVELRLHAERRLEGRRQPLTNAANEFGQIVLTVGVVERHHRY